MLSPSGWEENILNWFIKKLRSYFQSLPKFNGHTWILIFNSLISHIPKSHFEQEYRHKYPTFIYAIQFLINHKLEHIPNCYFCSTIPCVCVLTFELKTKYKIEWWFLWGCFKKKSQILHHFSPNKEIPFSLLFFSFSAIKQKSIHLKKKRKAKKKYEIELAATVDRVEKLGSGIQTESERFKSLNHVIVKPYLAVPQFLKQRTQQLRSSNQVPIHLLAHVSAIR